MFCEMTEHTAKAMGLKMLGGDEPLKLLNPDNYYVKCGKQIYVWKIQIRKGKPPIG